jgi:hypothetical protein
MIPHRTIVKESRVDNERYMKCISQIKIIAFLDSLNPFQSY